MKLLRYEFYEYFEKKQSEVLDEIQKIPARIGMPDKYKGKIGLSGGSGSPPLVHKDVSAAMEKSSRTLMKVADLDAEIRKIVKSYYGDEYDGAVTNTCEAALHVTYDVLFSPPFTGRGETYRSKYLAPYERHLHHQAGYGRPFPPQYKDLSADRGATAGELGVYAKRLTNLETVIVPLAGADYTCHGIKYHPCTLLLNVNPENSIKDIKKFADINREYLSGIASISYDTPGYGYGVKDDEGTSMLQKYLGALAKYYNIPYVVDNARGTPFIGTDIKKIDADVMVISTDKAFAGPTAGLIIGKEDKMIQIRRALGVHGMRWGTGSSHGKAGYVAFDPGKEIIAGLIKILEIIKDSPEKVTKAVDEMYQITMEEVKEIKPEIAEKLVITKSYNLMGVEINYENTWKNEKSIIPIFSIEDMYSGTNLIQKGCRAMGISPTLGYDANMPFGPNIGTTDEYGVLMEEPTRYAVKSLLKMLEVLNEFALKANK